MRCPECGSEAWTSGIIGCGGGHTGSYFQPRGAQWWGIRWSWGPPRFTRSFTACLACGLVWSYVKPDELRSFIAKECTKRGRRALDNFFPKKGPVDDL